MISGEVGLRKADASIYDLALHGLAVAPAATTFVDADPRRAMSLQGWGRDQTGWTVRRIRGQPSGQHEAARADRDVVVA
ncbi:hypothetical protein [Saccharopolyspora sp. ASAGF58]|uniref:hypothetical protein n=1 Tax=Saccharopolyspora sp. ASAGF58 TaxID=2719023 RepID=UPI0014402143|nr:hypothetical protein [Saccharopolyspora sp. ASAGF58]QIZ37141.1 hypothetical protein FDZ84_24040 [Saccharopolyspora sp. ASAGF58]